MNPIRIISFLFLSSILISCSSSRIVPIEIEKINFGYGGGFTGAVKSYSLEADGQLRQVEWEKDTLVKRIDVAVTQQLFERSKEFISYQFNEPGNMYSFLEIQSKKNTQKIMWGMNSQRVEKKVMQLYNELIALTK